MRRLGYFLAALLVCVAMMFIGYLGWRWVARSAKPVVVILYPDKILALKSGAGIAVSARAESQNGVARVALLMDGQVYAEQSGGDTQVFHAVFPWYASALGRHALQVVAYDSFGQASEPVEILIGVTARLEPERMDYGYIPPGESSNNGGEGDGGRVEPFASQGGSDARPLPPAEGAPPNEWLWEEVITTEDLELWPTVQDAPPDIALFDVSPRRSGTGVELLYQAQAQDDLGIDRLELSIQNAAVEPSWLTVRCFNDVNCSTDGSFPFAGPGVWLVSIKAVDSNGQASSLRFLSVEIAEGGGFTLDPAIVILDLFDAPPLLRIPQDIGGNDPNLITDNAVTGQNSCMKGLVEPRAGGHFISVTYLCEEQSTPGHVLEWKVMAVPSYGGGQDAEIIKRTYPDRATLAPGDNFAALYETPLCGTSTNYRISLLWRVELTGRVDGGSVLDLQEVPGPDCAGELIRDLQAAPGLSGADITWTLAQADNFPTGLSFFITRYSPIGRMFFQPNWQETIHTGFTASEQLAQGETTQTFTDLGAQCGFMPYYYTFALGLESPELRTAILERQPCPAGSIGNIPLELNAGYTRREEVNGQRLPLPFYASAITARSVIPPNFPWPTGDNLVLRLNVRPLDEASRGEFMLLPGNIMEVPVTQDVRANGFLFESVALAECNGTHYQWLYAWELLSNGQPIETGPSYQVNSAPCLPRSVDAPVFTNIHGSNDPAICGGNPYCVVIEWGPIPPASTDIPPTTLHRVDGLGLFRSLSSRSTNDAPAPNQFWTFSTGQFTFIDTAIGCIADGEITYRYEIFPMAQGLHGYSGPATAFIAAPICGRPYETVGTIR